MIIVFLLHSFKSNLILPSPYPPTKNKKAKCDTLPARTNNQLLLRKCNVLLTVFRNSKNIR